MKPIDRNCILMFDEMSEQLTFDKSRNMIIGYVDLGYLGRVNKSANHALIFMVHGLHKNWKHPVAGTVESKALQSLIKDIIIALEAAGLVVLATVCDQGATNRKSISNLCLETQNRNYEPNPYFKINNHKIFTLFDPPHLLKSTRNALLKYCINISVAAGTLSHTVAACMEQTISNPCNNLAADAIHTAEFIHDIDYLFVSFNGRLPSPELGKPYRRCLSDKSAHKPLWLNLKPKVQSWEFIS
ncbi:hypothetical protein YQE_07012, partial [Dendroctonus ponderosae]